MRSCTGHADQGKYRRAKWLAYCRLFGRQQNRDGHYALDFFSVDAGLGGLCQLAPPSQERNQSGERRSIAFNCRDPV
jgi:hypothetical protein